MSDVEVFETFITAKIREESAKCVLVSNHVVFECERLELRQLRHLLGKADDDIVVENLVADDDLAPA